MSVAKFRAKVVKRIRRSDRFLASQRARCIALHTVPHGPIARTLTARLIVVEVRDGSHVVRLATSNGRQRQGEEKIRKLWSSAVPDAAPRQCHVVLQAVRHFVMSQLFQSLPNLSRQGACNGRVEA